MQARHNQDASILYNLVLTSHPIWPVGGRLFYVLSYPEAFLASPRSIISLNPGLFDISGACWRTPGSARLWGSKKASFLVYAGCFDSGTGNFCGIPPSGQPGFRERFRFSHKLPWAIELWGARRHPTQVYESLAAAMILVFYCLFCDRSTQTRPEGTFFGVCGAECRRALVPGGIPRRQRI
jgi:prolipoprotein diacylglyceryltransferase